MTIKPNNRHSGDSERSVEDSRISSGDSKRGDSGQARMTGYGIVSLILIIALFLRTYRLDELIPFIGDFAWFYISARDMLLTGNIPLVGITSSHTWVHQGPLWTYLLSIPLFISNFNPISGAYLTAILGVLTVFLMYKIGTQMFSRFVGITASVLYATSPLVIIHSRMPYHTSIIPLASLLFIYFLYKWIKGDVRFLPFIFLALGALYNLELATMVFWFLLILIFAYGFVKRKLWFTQALKPNVIFLSIFLFLLVMLPMIIHDVREYSGFYQTTAFFRLIKIYLFSQSHMFSFDAMVNIFTSLFSYNQRLVFLANGTIASILTVISFIYLLVRHSGDSERRDAPDGASRSEEDSIISSRSSERGDSGQARMTKSRLLLILWITIPLFGIVVSRTASEAYLPMIFPAVILSISILFNYIYKRHVLIVLVTILSISIINSYILITKNYFNSFSFSKMTEKAREIVKESNGKEYNLVGKGEGSEHKSFIMNYEYLTWWLGHPPSKDDQPLKVVLIPDKDSIHVLKKVYNKN